MHAFAAPRTPFDDSPPHAEPRRRDLRRSTSPRACRPSVFRALYDAFLRTRCCVFPPSDLPPAAQVAFARQFGEVQVHVMSMYHADGFPELYRLSNLDAEGKPNGRHPDKGTLVWHTDGSWRRITGQATIIYGEIVPEIGGETHFCDMYGAYERLDRRLEAAHRRPRRRPQPRLLAHPKARHRPDDRGAEARGAAGRASGRASPSRDRPHVPLSRRPRRVDRRHAVRRGPRAHRRAERARDPRRPRLPAPLAAAPAASSGTTAARCTAPPSTTRTPQRRVVRRCTVLGEEPAGIDAR